MSGLAAILLQMGKRVTGSDLKENNLIKKLQKKGCEITIGHKKIIGKPDAVIKSYCISQSNPEIVEAKEMGIPVFDRLPLLRDLMGLHDLAVSVCGTHGKTTTTAMIVQILLKLKADPTYMIGSELISNKDSAAKGGKNIMVTELDESDGYFSTFSSGISVITNIEKEHLERYRTMKNMMQAYKRFADRNKKNLIIANGDDKNVKKILAGRSHDVISFGVNKQNDFHVKNIHQDKKGAKFDIVHSGTCLGSIRLKVGGRHNCLNALAATCVCLQLGHKFKDISMALSGFQGAKRRFHLRLEKRRIRIIEDYAHHPTEIRAVVENTARLKPKRLVAVFQPHRFSRSRYLLNEFSKCFSGIDWLILTDIYAASEKPIKNISIKKLYNKIPKDSLGRVEMMKKNQIAHRIKGKLRPGDVILVMGAGDIDEIISEIKRVV